jgi:hypothetical protein
MKIDTPPLEMKVDTSPQRGRSDDESMQVDKLSDEALTTSIPFRPTTKRRTTSTESSSDERSSDEEPLSKKQARQRERRRKKRGRMQRKHDSPSARTSSSEDKSLGYASPEPAVTKKKLKKKKKKKVKVKNSPSITTSSSDDTSSRYASSVPAVKKKKKKKKKKAKVKEESSRSCSDLPPLAGPTTSLSLPDNRYTFAFAATPALKNYPVSILSRNKNNCFVFRSNMLTVLQCTMIEGRNLI